MTQQESQTGAQSGLLPICTHTAPSIQTWTHGCPCTTPALVAVSFQMYTHLPLPLTPTCYWPWTTRDGHPAPHMLLQGALCCRWALATSIPSLGKQVAIRRY
eukprot:859189-Ditylum_brightwellii.AAC.1